MTDCIWDKAYQDALSPEALEQLLAELLDWAKDTDTQHVLVKTSGTVDTRYYVDVSEHDSPFIRWERIG